MAPLPLVYVHGAGPQASAAAFKDEADQLMFGRRMSTTGVAHYAGVRWPRPTGGGPSAAPRRSDRRRVTAIRAAMRPQVPAKAAAAGIVAATLASPRGAGLGAASDAAPASAADIDEATNLVTLLLNGYLSIPIIRSAIAATAG